MQRIIKFRVWNTEEKKIGYFHSLKDFCNLYQDYQDIWIIQQFTGLLDKNGKEIYEGDIINCSIPYETLKNQIIQFNHKKGAFTLKQYGTFLADVRRIKIVGNIFETPNLIN